jgi:hypothetical protein
VVQKHNGQITERFLEKKRKDKSCTFRRYKGIKPGMLQHLLNLAAEQ